MMHVRIGYPVGVRHRLWIDRAGAGSRRWSAAVTNGRTACNVALAGLYYSPLEESYEGVLCEDGCFSKHELEEAKAAAKSAEERRHEQAEQMERERAAALALALERSRETVRRLRTGETEPIQKADPEDVEPRASTEPDK